MNENPNGDVRAAPTAEDDQEVSNKRAALPGQWRTPPLPVFPNAAPATTTSHSRNDAESQPSPIIASTPDGNSGSEEPSAVASAIPRTTLPSVDKLPMSTEDYVKALQEAYLRGAEAAAAMAAARQHRSATQTHVPDPIAPGSALQTAASCPDFQQTSRRIQPSLVKLEANILPQPAPVSSAVPDPTSTISSIAVMPPPAPVHHQQAQTTVASAQPPTYAAPAPPQQSNVAAAPPRAMSLPDMTSYAAQQEEDKRQKRLARNRASARLRRLRKKNLVDAYETEVGILEKTLSKLQAHEWGSSEPNKETDVTEGNSQYSAQPLLEALSMDRGQQELSPDERKQAAADILQQQLTFLQQLEELMQEQFVLSQIANDNQNDEFQELRQALQLSPEQVAQLQLSSAGWHEEWAALQTVKQSLVAMKENEWLWDDGVASIVDQFTSILNKNQISKFLLWSDHNADAIDELDIVNAAPGVPAAPIFQFGADSVPESAVATGSSRNANSQQNAAASRA